MLPKRNYIRLLRFSAGNRLTASTVIVMELRYSRIFSVCIITWPAYQPVFVDYPITHVDGCQDSVPMAPVGNCNTLFIGTNNNDAARPI